MKHLVEFAAGLRGAVVNEPYIEHQFRNCVVRLWPDERYMQTRFPDGTFCPAVPVLNAESQARARSLGYGEDLARMSVEHELAHTVLAEAYGLPHSPALWAVAHGEAPPHNAQLEEATVLGLQRFGREKAWHPILNGLGNVRAVQLALRVKRIADRLMEVACV